MLHKNNVSFFNISSRRTLGGLTVSLMLMATPVTGALADTSTYYLNQSNIDNVLPDGTDYLKVTITSLVAGGASFDVTPVYAFTQGVNFGMQSFGFNYGGSDSVSGGNFSGLASGWAVDMSPSGNQGGFGKFDFIIKSTGSNRQSPLSFTVTGLGGTTSAETLGYLAKLSSANAGQGNQFFAAHLAGFVMSDATVTSGYFAGSSLVTPVPVPVPVPEPETYAMLLAGLGLLGFVARRRKTSVK